MRRGPRRARPRCARPPAAVTVVSSGRICSPARSSSMVAVAVGKEAGRVPGAAWRSGARCPRDGTGRDGAAASAPSPGRLGAPPPPPCAAGGAASQWRGARGESGERLPPAPAPPRPARRGPPGAGAALRRGRARPGRAVREGERRPARSRVAAPRGAPPGPVRRVSSPRAPSPFIYIYLFIFGGGKLE